MNPTTAPIPTPLQTLLHQPAVPHVAVIGLGYVGLPLAVRFANSGATVTGIDADHSKVAHLRHGESYLHHIPAAEIQRLEESGNFSATADHAEIANADAILLCLPTPLSPNRAPDLSFVMDTARLIAPHLREGVLVSLESTTYPGTTEEVLGPLLEQESGLRPGVDFHLAYSPEREDPGHNGHPTAEVPKLVAGLTSECLQRAIAIYGFAVPHLVPVNSCRVAEAAKLLENIFRSVNIALVNELKLVYGAMDIDIWEVIEAAKTKPFGFMPFQPGPGLGGHCIPIDPFYLTWRAREFGCATRFIELAGEINTQMPAHVVSRTIEALNHHGKALHGARILAVGVAYKADVDDDRESPSYKVIELLRHGGAVVDYHDPYIPEIPRTRSHPEWQGTRSVPWEEETIRTYDAVIILTAHHCVPHADLAQWASCVIDTRNVMSTSGAAPEIIWKA